MINFHFVTAVENIIIDSSSNQASFINLIDEVNTPKVPVVFPLMRIITQWYRSDISNDEEVEFRVRLKYPSGEFFKESFTFKGTFPKDMRRLRTIASIQGIPINEFGEMNFVVERKDDDEWNMVGCAPISVKQAVSSQ